MGVGNVIIMSPGGRGLQKFRVHTCSTVLISPVIASSVLISPVIASVEGGGESKSNEYT